MTENLYQGHLEEGRLHGCLSRQAGKGDDVSVVERGPFFETLSIRNLDEGDISEICTWITSRESMRLVASEDADCLTGEIVKNWRDNAEHSFAIDAAQSGKPVGFFTLSDQESEHLPPHRIELCHLIVDPALSYRWIATRAITFGAMYARKMGRSEMIGRVVIHNRYMHAVLKYMKLARLDLSRVANGTLENGFAWYFFDLYGLEDGRYRIGSDVLDWLKHTLEISDHSRAS